MAAFIRRRLGMGWLPDYPDFRDLTVENDHVSSRLQSLGQKDSVKKMLSKTGTTKVAPPKKVNLVSWFPPIEDQGDRLVHSKCGCWAG